MKKFMVMLLAGVGIVAAAHVLPVMAEDAPAAPEVVTAPVAGGETEGGTEVATNSMEEGSEKDAAPASGSMAQ